ncbi:putative MFS family arabinose efflux permease [Kushneria sinocarnis]|uniref:Putative MFS family arabinose efflux permease n=1 Tax=Kushneria sinocarnis TaxID=595502 RepID=A0A420WU33_9GAMM|nr:MFS transporter [Kushneria sinocarnis]RKQ96948.1 putative MFS family arabinose efflux permease [Kushneria sinocarnis]
MMPDVPRSSGQRLAVWRISAAAALLGLGQNGFLVALPMLVAHSGLALEEWAGLLLLGSMLFVVGSPFWGRFSDRHGSRPVVLQALVGYIVSFTLVASALAASMAGLLQGLTLISVVAMARVIYGLTVAGMVPGCQRWAVALEPENQRSRALAAISAGLSTGRLMGPLVAGASLGLSFYAPFVIMVMAGVLAMLLVAGVADPGRDLHASSAPATWRGRRLNRKLWPYIGLALAVSMALSLMQLGLPDALQHRLAITPDRASHLMGIMLSLGALGSLLVQLLAVRRRRLPWPGLVAGGILAALLGTLLLTLAHTALWLALGTIATSIGIALAVPGYNSRAGQLQGQGAGSGLMGMMHTLGYGMATAIVALAPATSLLPLALAACGCGALLGWPIARDARRAGE